MFVEDEELMEITVHFKKIGRHYIAYNAKSFENAGLSDEQKATFQSVTLKVRPLAWGLYNDLQEAAMVKDNLGNRAWNYKVYKENKLKSIIVKWDAMMQNEEGKMIPVPVSHRNISKMSPDIAEVILNTYDQMTLIDEDEEKKS